jgi:DNA-binding CsgD family transcriptional regulator
MEGGMRGTSLSRADYKAALDFVAMLGEATDLDDFAERLADGLHGAFDCAAGSYNEVDFRRRRVRWVTDLPAGPQHVEAFQRHMAENPIIAHFHQHPLGEAVKMSDFVDAAQFRDLGVYSEIYRPLGAAHLLAMQISLQPVSIDVALFSDGADFGERDRAVLTLLRPHLANAYRNAAALTDYSHRLALLEDGLDAAGLGALVLTEDGRIRSSTPAARRLMSIYFDNGPSHDRLPGPLAEWLSRATPPASSAERLPLAQPLVIERDKVALVARVLQHGRLRLILLRERRSQPSPRALAVLGLAPREAEVLLLVAAGRTDPEIAESLSISPRTVSHTLEHVYRKLGVESRAAAVAKAMRAPEL